MRGPQPESRVPRDLLGGARTAAVRDHARLRLGSIGDAGAFSFNYFKIISCGEGGALITDDDMIHEKVQIYHDCGANFWPYQEKQTVPIFLGIQLRASEIMGAIMRIQMKRLDGILMDLRRIEKEFISELSDLKDIYFLRSNDREGECGIVVPLLFEGEETARKFAEYPGIDGWLPIDTGRHIYTNWDPVMTKKAGPNEFLNPYNLPQNKGLQSAYSMDMCPNTLDILGRTVFVSANPDWSEQDVENKLDVCRKAFRRL